MVKFSLLHFENFQWETEGPWPHIILKILCETKDSTFQTYQKFQHQIVNIK